MALNAFVSKQARFWSLYRSTLHVLPRTQYCYVSALLQRRFSVNQPTRSPADNSNVIKSNIPDLDFVQDKSLPEFLFDKFDTYGDKPAIIDGITGQQCSYAQMYELVIKVGSALAKLGFKKGDVCAIFSHNSLEFPIIYFAILSVGGIATLISSMATVREVCYQLNDTSAQYIFTAPAMASFAKEAAGQCGLKEVFVVGESEGCQPISELFKDDGKSFPKDIQINPKEDVAILPYSSGTTGLPKGVMLTHFNLSANIQQLVDAGFYDTTFDDNVLGLAPFFHVLGFNVAMSASFYVGATLISLPKFEPELFLKTIQNFKITRFFTVPPVILFLAKGGPIVDKYDLSSLRALSVGAAPMSKDMEHIFCERFKSTRISQGYGLTETSPVITISPVEAPRPGSTGVVLPNSEVKVVDLSTGEALGENEQGEICVRGPHVMKGYLNNPKATGETIDSEGWLRTGDIGYYDADRYFFVVDRCKELIKYKGYQVAPGELEAVLIAHPKIQDAAVIGIPDEECGELPKGFVVAKDVSREEIHDYLVKNVAPNKKLRGGIEYVDEIPKSLSGKILRRVLKEQVLSKK